MNQKSFRRELGGFTRRLHFESLEARIVLASAPEFIALTVDPNPAFGQASEGGNESETDPVKSWALQIQIIDLDGGVFDLEYDLNNNGIYREVINGVPEPTIEDVTVPAFDETEATLVIRSVAVDWDAMIAFGIADTHDLIAPIATRQYVVGARAIEVNPLGPPETHSSTANTDLDVFNSMPFFVTADAAPTGGGGGCGGSNEVTVSGTFTEYGVNDAVTLRVHWGDGNTDIVYNAALMSNQQNVPFSVSHTYATDGLKNITWDIFDDEGGAASLPDNPASKGGESINVGGGPSVCLNGTVLTVIGSAGNDSVTITQPTGLVRVETSFLPTASEFTLASVQSILVQLGAGDDTLVSFSTLPMVAVGGDGNDILTGGSGRNVLIGGLGADLLTGGDDEDILVDGATIHDNNAVALLAILAEWISNHSFVDRMKNLTNGSGSVQGLNETTEGSYFLVPDGNDGEFDFLVGGDGKDWIVRRHK